MALGQLRSAPTAGAVAALCAAQASALVTMVARSVAEPSGGTASARSDPVSPLLAACEELVGASLDLMEHDAELVDALMSALSLPRETTALETLRSEAVRAALADAVGPQLGILEIGARLIGLMEDLAPHVGPGIHVDLAGAAEVAGTAVSVARLNVEANASFISDTDHRGEIQEALVAGSGTIARLRDLVGQITAGI